MWIRETHYVVVVVVYRGCADSKRWSGLNISNGCSLQSYLGWNNRKTLWCFCDTILCNVRPIKSFPDVTPLIVALKQNESNSFMQSPKQFEKTSSQSDENTSTSESTNPTQATSQENHVTPRDDVIHTVHTMYSTQETVGRSVSWTELFENDKTQNKPQLLNAHAFSKDQIFYPEAAIAETREVSKEVPSDVEHSNTGDDVTVSRKSTDNNFEISFENNTQNLNVNSRRTTVSAGQESAGIESYNAFYLKQCGQVVVSGNENVQK